MSRGLPDSWPCVSPYVRGIDATDAIHEHQVFLVERYQPGATLDDVRMSVARLDALSRRHRTVRHVSSTLVPAEEAIFAVFLAGDADAVVRLNHEAGLRVDRVVVGVHLTVDAHVEGIP